MEPPINFSWILRQVTQCSGEVLQCLSVSHRQTFQLGELGETGWNDLRFPGSELVPRRCCLKSTLTFVTSVAIAVSKDNLEVSRAGIKSCQGLCCRGVGTGVQKGL